MATEPWKDHDTAQLVNRLRDLAKTMHDAQQLRERIAEMIRPLAERVKVSEDQLAHERQFGEEMGYRMGQASMRRNEASKQEAQGGQVPDWTALGEVGAAAYHHQSDEDGVLTRMHPWAYAAKKIIEAHGNLAATPATPAQAERVCGQCGGSGDVHSIDGEWRGKCTVCDNPENDDGAALRLALDEHLHIGVEDGVVSAWEKDRFGNFQVEAFGDDKYRAARKAIVRAVADKKGRRS